MGSSNLLLLKEVFQIFGALRPSLSEIDQPVYSMQNPAFFGNLCWHAPEAAHTDVFEAITMA
jgi:hypothetical protein